MSEAERYQAELEAEYCRQMIDMLSRTDIVAVSAGYDNAVGLKSNGTVVAVGRYRWRSYVYLCEMLSWTDIVAVSAGKHRVVGLKSNGKVVITSEVACDIDDKEILAAAYWENHAKEKSAPEAEL